MMNFGFGVGDFLTISELAWRVYRSCRDSSSDFAELSSEIESMNTVITEIKEQYLHRGLSEQARNRTQQLLRGCESVLRDVESRLANFESLGSNKKRLRDRIKFAAEAVGELRIRLVVQASLLASFQVAQAK
jgi:hypothetical protein